MTNPMKIAIASGKGGTGKTFISTNLFNLLQKKGLNVALVDCDAEEPNCRLFLTEGKLEATHEVNQKIPELDLSKCTYCGKCADYCNYNAIFFLKEPKIKCTEEICQAAEPVLSCDYGAISEKMTSGPCQQVCTFTKSALIESEPK